jgi:hypothetical protein
MADVENDPEKHLYALKKKIAKIYGSSLVNILTEQKPLNVLKKIDSEEIRNKKIEENNKIIKEREEEYRSREDEILAELERIISRVKKDNNEMRKKKTQLYSTSSSTAAAVQIFCCEECGNDVSF